MFGIGNVASGSAGGLWALLRGELQNADASVHKSLSIMSVFGEPQGGGTTANETGETASGNSACSSRCTSMFSGSVLGTLLSMQERASSSDGATPNTSGFGQQLFSKLDADGDGAISKAEFEASFTTTQGSSAQAADAWFAKADKRGDLAFGDGEEASAIHRGHHRGFVRHALDRFDVDGDSVLSKSELESAFTARGKDLARVDAVLARFDTDGDGSISGDELAAGVKHAYGLGFRHRVPHAPDVTTDSDGTAGTGAAIADNTAPSDSTPIVDQPSEEPVTENSAAA